jgi:exonuclease SbcD
MVKPFFDKDMESYDEAVETIIASEDINPLDRNILIAHQFVTSGQKQPERCDSESISLGGTYNVDTKCFQGFDYVALGHLHGPQRIGRDTIRYAGSPLKYSFSEARQRKSVTILTMKEKGEVEIELLPLKPLRDMREIKGPIEELLKAGQMEKEGAFDYIHATLTDEEDIYDAVGQLRQVYKNLMSLDFENSRNNPGILELAATDSNAYERKSPLFLFTEFYEAQNNVTLSEEQEQIIRGVLEKAVGEGEV